MPPVARWVIVLPLVLVLAACGGQNVGDALGLGRRQPDEFQVVQRAPLVVPPQVGLRPPEPGAPRPQEGTPAERAQAALTGSPVPAGEATPGQSALLAAAGTGAADPQIRTVLAEEGEGLAGLDESRFWFILDFQRRAYARTEGNPINATAEAQRLREAGVNVRGARIDTQPGLATGGV